MTVTKLDEKNETHKYIKTKNAKVCGTTTITIKK